MILRNCILTLALAGITFGAVAVSAGETDGHAEIHKMVVAVKTDDFELVETDISDLGIGDAETIHTESGKTIDLLKTEDGVEIYVDGELIDTGLGSGEEMHEAHHVIHKRIEIECESEDECDEMVWMSDEGDIDVEALIDEHVDEEILHGEGENKRVIVIKKKVESS